MCFLSRSYYKLNLTWLVVLDAEQRLELDWELAWLDWATDGFGDAYSPDLQG